ncbi:hypothetical protein GUITHDRAFT_121371 [Guillardia theta CCMP2712]|uniref:BAH domain-containing protein n=3 Tax=Guillardia theta TaxID=55529 RepID=L1I879_GUITC|nr:hypothetical protein GUITHDRAFT_121371 [Guillardia theta CCMP2712]EKX32476.1 hypothetical protein GUITHDRAFT_121371 [Guillardia theta CCMP2712]|eukprot:XP_005819456.1 hypothetical protein GUITHDRAFT_121371 [Guillardia theta CCMP2712]
MRAALQTHGTDQEEGIWIGEPAGKWKGNTLYVGVVLRGKYYASGADVYIRGEEGERQYIARITRMYERASDSARMIGCRWYYRSDETNLNKDKKKSSSGANDQELYISDVVDDNPVNTIEDLCNVRAKFLIEDMNAWLQQRNNFTYSLKYVPTLGVARELSDKDIRDSKAAFAANSRSERLTQAYQSLGRCQYASLEVPFQHKDELESQNVTVIIKQGKHRTSLKQGAELCCAWRSILYGVIYNKISAFNREKKEEPPRAQTLAKTKKTEVPLNKKPENVAKQKTPEEDFIENHKKIQWIGSPVKTEGTRTYYSKVLLANGTEVKVGTAVKLLAPDGEPSFLGKVQCLWGSSKDHFKMMRCKWFYRPEEAPGYKGTVHAREVFISEHQDEQYLTTIEKPCTIMHDSEIPGEIREDFLKHPDNFFYRMKYLPDRNNFVVLKEPVAIDPVTAAKDRPSSASRGKKKSAASSKVSEKRGSDTPTGKVAAESTTKRPLEVKEEDAAPKTKKIKSETSEKVAESEKSDKKEKSEEAETAAAAAAAAAQEGGEEKGHDESGGKGDASFPSSKDDWYAEESEVTDAGPHMAWASDSVFGVSVEGKSQLGEDERTSTKAGEEGSAVEEALPEKKEMEGAQPWQASSSSLEAEPHKHEDGATENTPFLSSANWISSFEVADINS